MTPTHTVHVTREIAAPAAAIWARISDHAATHTWVLPARVELLERGEPSPNGVGAIRSVAFPEKKLWTAIRERITAFSAPTSFSYAITDGMPGLRDHLGTLSVEPLGESRSRVVWHIDFVFSRWHPMGWIAGPFTRTFTGVVEAALGELDRQLAH